MAARKASFRNYDYYMTNIQNVSQKTDSTYDDDQQLIYLEKIVSESKIDKNLQIELVLL